MEQRITGLGIIRPRSRADTVLRVVFVDLSQSWHGEFIKLRAIAVDMTAHVSACQAVNGLGRWAAWRLEETKLLDAEEFVPSAMKSRPSLGADFTVYR